MISIQNTGHGIAPLFAVAPPPKVTAKENAFGKQEIEVENPQTAILKKCEYIMQTLLKRVFLLGSL